MMKFILIVVLIAHGTPDRVSVGGFTAEFDNPTACSAAMNEVQRMGTDEVKVQAVCVSKAIGQLTIGPKGKVPM